ncbi:MAG: hypothetical protein HOV87_26450 [Catenulispora sp.]|nr:hypothetical protein [Catenulispora sp.]
MGYLGGPVVDAAAARVRVPLPAVPSGAPVRVRDVLLNRGRVLDAEEQAAFGLYRRALRLLEETGSRFPPLADILLIAASQGHGPADPLTGQPWPDPPDSERRFLTIVLHGKVLRCARTAGCRLGTGCHTCPFPAASGVTLEGPAAVYAADASARRVDDEVAAVRLAATLMHEYTHVALRRMYDNVSLPWFERETAPPELVDRRIVRFRAHRNARVSALMEAFDGMRTVRIPDSEPNPELRAYLVDIAADWCGYAAGTRLRYQESVPYLAEAYFHACRLHRPDAVSSLYGLLVSGAPFVQFLAPEFADFAAVVRAGGQISDV